jgi:hypothetical protein
MNQFKGQVTEVINEGELSLVRVQVVDITFTTICDRKNRRTIGICRKETLLPFCSKKLKWSCHGSQPAISMQKQDQWRNSAAGKRQGAEFDYP